MSKNNRSSCPLVNLLDILGDKWSLIVVRDIFHGKKTFADFLTSPEKISTSVLTTRLKLLERAGITQHILSKIDKKVKFYFLTDRGIDLYPIIYEMVSWSKRNLNQEFHPIAKDWFELYETHSTEEVILENQNSYKTSREKLLNLQ